MKEETNLSYCENCSNQLDGAYCSSCGSPKKIKRIDKKYVIHEVRNVLNFNKGIFYTIKELLIRPGKTIREFILKDRNRLIKPIVFIIISSLFYTLSQQLFNFEDGYVNYSIGEDSVTTTIFDWITKHYGYANFFIAIFIAFWIKIFFKKYNYNFFEILVLLCFVMGTGMLIFAIFGIVDSFVNLRVGDKGFIIGVIYIVWAIGQFFDKKKFSNYLKALSSYFLGLFSFSISVLMVGFLIDWIIK